MTLAQTLPLLWIGFEPRVFATVLWDRIFGTWHMPPGEVPTRFGADDEPVPAGLWRRVAYPFRRPRRGERLAGDVV